MKIPQWQWNRILVVMIVMFILYMAMPIYLLLILAALFSLLLLPSVKWLEKRLDTLNLKIETRRNLAVVIAFFVSISLVVIAGIFIFRPLVQELASFITTLPEAVNALQVSVVQFLSENQDKYFALPTQIKGMIDNAAHEILNFAIARINSFLQFVAGATSIVVQAVLLPFLIYYFLRDREYLLKELNTLVPVRRRDQTNKLVEELGSVLTRYIRGQLTVCLITGSLVFVGTTLLGVKYPIVLGALAFLFESIPYAGPILSFIPAFLLAFSASPELALKVTAFYLIVSFLENNFIVPVVMGQVIKIHPLVILLGMLLAANWFGLIGMILAVPAIAAIRILIRFAWNWR